MTIIADARKRVILRGAKPGDRFDVQVPGDGTFVLRRLEPVKGRTAKVRIEKRGGYSVGVTDRPINEEALKAALADFP
jgi:hypothetical protein